MRHSEFTPGDSSVSFEVVMEMILFPNPVILSQREALLRPVSGFWHMAEKYYTS